MKNTLAISSIVGGKSSSGGGAGGTTNYDNLTNKPQVNGIVLSGNKTSADLGITTLTPFPSTWPTTGKFEDLLAAIRVDTIAVKGASFLGEVTFDDLPANLGNAEIKVEILEGTTSATKVIHSVITSGNREPYRWEYTSWNSGNSNSGWISFQLPLTAGDGISIENNVISTTGGNVYTQSNLLAGKGIEIIDEPVEGGIDNHTLACWHLDNDRTNAVTNDSAWGIFGNVNTSGSGFDTNIYKFGNASYTGGSLSSNPSLGYVEKSDSFTLDFWAQKYSDTTNFAQFGFISSSYNELGFYLSPTDGVSLDGLKLSSTQPTVSLSNFNIDFSDNEFHHIAYIYDKDIKKVYFYCDGKIITSADTVNNLTYHLLLNMQFSSSYFRLDEIRFSDIARPLNDDGTFPVPTKPYSLAIPTGNKVINNTVTKTSQLTNDSGFIAVKGYTKAEWDALAEKPTNELSLIEEDA